MDYRLRRVNDSKTSDLGLNDFYNRPVVSETFTRTQFANEWIRVFEKLKSALGEIGKHDEFGDVDVSMGISTIRDRTIGIALITQEVIGPETIGTIKHALSNIPEDYRAMISGSWGLDSFFVSIPKAGDVVGYCKQPEALEALGVP